MTIQNLFPTPIFEVSNFISEELNHTLKNYIISFSSTEINNKIILHTELPELNYLSTSITEHAFNFINKYYFYTSQIHVDAKMACHFRSPGAYNAFPKHTDILWPITTLFQAIYYVEGNMGNLRLYDPRWLDIEWRNKLEKDTLYYEVQVAPRKLVVFPTFLSHDVSEYTDETSMRISLDTGIEVK